MQAPNLRKLALGSHLIHTHVGDDEVPPLASAEVVLRALRVHPALREVLLVARPGIMSAGVRMLVWRSGCAPACQCLCVHLLGSERRCHHIM